MKDPMTPHRIAASMLVLMLAATVAAAAGDPPCVAEVKKYCATEPAGVGAIQACLKKHEADLSATCRAKVDDLQKEIGAIAATCRFDIMRFCDDVTPGGGRVATCLQNHRDDLSPECKDRLPKKN
jgi:hypothetical protein